MNMETLIDTKKVPFIQRTKSGCGSYSLANLFNDERFIKGVEDLHHGEGVADMNKKLSKIEPDFYIDVLYQTCYEFDEKTNKLTDSIALKVKYEEMTEEMKCDFARPFFFTVKRSLYHCILVIHNFKNDLYYVVDSLDSHVLQFTLEELMKRYHIIAVELLCNWNMNGSDRSIFINKNRLNHIIPADE